MYSKKEAGNVNTPGNIEIMANFSYIKIDYSVEEESWDAGLGVSGGQGGMRGS